MRTIPNLQRNQAQCSTWHHRGKLKPLILAAHVLAVLLTLAGSTVWAANLLQNGNFNSSLAGTWNVWTYGGGWAGSSTNPNEVYDGTQFVYCGGSDGQGGGLNQVLFAQPGIPYTMSCASAVSAWWWPEAQMRLIFLDANDVELSLTLTNCAAGITGFDTGLAWSNYTMTVTSPAGTVKVKAEFACFGHGTVRFDNAVLTAPLVYPTIENVSPDGSSLMQITNSFSFTAASTATPISDSGIQLTVNGVNVSASLVIGGSSMSKTATYAGITSNRTYTASIQVADTGGLIVTKTVTFDTFSPTYYTWEAEDYDYSGGLHLENPQTNAYFGLVGTPDVDYHAAVNDNIQLRYRASDTVGTEGTTDAQRPQYAGTNDYSVGWFDGGEWLNYTRTLPAGLFNVYARMSSPGVSTLNLSQVTSGQGTATQTTASLGNFVLENGQGWSVYSWVPLTDASGSLTKLTLGGLATLRATSGGNANAQFFMLVPANTNLPAITGLYPDGTTLFQSTNTLRFGVTSAAGVNPQNISVTLSVVNPVASYTTNLTSTNGLTMTGTDLNRIVSYAGLLPNSRYTAVIRVADINDNVTTINPKFDTYSPVLMWEAEDWDYGTGLFIDNPPVNAYMGLAGAYDVDVHDINGTGDHTYRPSDGMAAGLILDTPTPQQYAAGTNNYAVGYFANGEWINYTRTVPSGAYNVYGRFAAGGDTGIQSLSLVTNGVGTAVQEVKPLGRFAIANTGGWGTYQFVPLRDEFGNLASVTLSGKSTLKLQRVSGADANVNLFILIPAETGLPTITQVTPSTWMQSTNKLQFVASSGVGIATSNIVLTLNGTTVTNLAFSGSATSWSVSCPLAPSAPYTAVIRVTDNNGLVATTTVNFDTFSAAGFTWEAEDFDYENGLFFDNPAVNAYIGLAGFEGVDLHDTANGGTALYRVGNVATEFCNDLVRTQYSSINARDYNVGYTAGGEWLNYTHSYPTGKFNVYLRAARGDAGNSAMGLQKVTSGWGTTNQTTATLGTFTVPGTGGWQNFAWVPLRDSSGNLVPVSLGGTNTLRLTDGGANLNFLALAPALVLDASTSGGNINLSFNTQAGFIYAVLYTDNLDSGSWTELTTVAGDGTVKTVGNTMAGPGRFYRLQVR